MSLTITGLVERTHTNAVNKGFWDKPRETGTLIALIHSEVTEALDAGSCANFCEELADIVIRIADLCGGKKIDLEKICKADLSGSVFDLSSINSLEKSICDHPEFSAYHKEQIEFTNQHHACDVHRYLSYALEADRKNNGALFADCMASAFLLAFLWAAVSGYAIEDNIIQKMAVNERRPRLHGKAY